jgi:PAS domain S-box-containing protein
MQSENKELPSVLLENFADCKILKESADETKRILDCIGDLLFVIDANRVIIKVNKSTCDMFKKKPEELIGKHCYEIVHGTKAPWCNCPATKTFERKHTVTEEVNDSNLGVPLLVTTSPILDDQGEVAQVIHIAKDITQMKLAETELHIAANLFGAASDSILVHDLDGKLIYFNESAYKTRGYTEEEFQALTIKDLDVPGNPRFFGDRMKELVEKGEATFEAVNLRKDKKVVPVEIHAQVIESDGRKLILSVARDISKRKATEQELADSQAKYQTTFKASMDALMLLDGQSFLDCNNETLRLFGLHSIEEFTKFHPADLSPPTQPDGTPSMNAAMSHIQKAFQTGTDHFFWIHKRTDGTTFPADVLLTRMPLKGREVLQATVRDIAEQKKAEQALIASLKRYQSYIEVTGELGWTTNAAGEVLEDIPSFRNFTGQTYDEVKGWGWTKAVHPDDLEHATRAWQTAVAAKTKYEVEYRLRRYDGIYRNFMARGAPISDDDGEICEWVGTCIDITDRKEASEKLANLKEFDERVIDSLDDALLVIDPDDYKIISTNEAALKQLKLRKEELIGKTCYQTTHHLSTPCQPPEHDCPIRRVLETRENVIVEHKHFDENNNELIVEVSARFVKNPEGKPVIIHVARDITERKQMETRIREAEKRYHALFDRAPFGILVFDAENAKIIEFNEVAHEQLGYSREEFTKLRIFDFIAAETQDETKDRIVKVLREGKDQFEAKHRTKNGEIRDVVVSVQAIELSGKTFFHSIYRDVTEAKKVDDALMESEAKYRQLVELAQEGVWALDNENRTVFVNPRMAKMLGYNESEMMGKNLVTFLVKPDSDLAQHNLEGCKLGKQGQCEFEFIKKDGTHVYTNIAASSIQDDNGTFVGTLALVADITERKNMEVNLKESRDKLEIMNEKLGVVGSLTRHDVRNKLSAVTGYAYILKKKHSDLADVVDGLSRMEQAVAESVKIFDFAKMYEQIGMEELTYINVEEKIKEAVALFSAPMPTIINDCQGLKVLADSFLRQLFYNFIDNTRKYGKKTTTIRVYYEKMDFDSLRLVYEDDGVGVPLENKPRLFKEGFSTGGSTGFGLFLTKRMIDVYGWTIEENGKPGVGAKFTVTIPKLDKNGLENYRLAF